MHEYKESKDFEDDIAIARADAYIFSFINYRDAVAQAYPDLDLSYILAPEKEKGGAKG